MAKGWSFVMNKTPLHEFNTTQNQEIRLTLT